ncbi:FtsK/SpoIIIE domain-containing protein [Sciscionella sediminilitoris]|uniref:FtsK/SpoIIIE domain-containing protein n=1 Tax=Sciscionella sediminilitoris TaxID=1445613 RepID=UPI0009E76D93|nr:FtsK/SpoIIIE domain-containing protein [Sciscionella sp. SE31]
MNPHEHNQNSPNSHEGTELEVKVFDGELVTGQHEPDQVVARARVAGWSRVPIECTARIIGRVRESDRYARVRSVLGYRLRKAPVDVARLVWFLLRGHGRWIRKAWTWVTHADLRADARAARLSGDPEARREAQETIRADARARWAKLGIVLRRTVISTAAGVTLLVVLALLNKIVDRADMPAWLATIYDIRDILGTVLATMARYLVILGPIGWAVAAIWEGRDRTPGAGWLTQPDRDDADSWVDERMISRALAHLGVAPLNAFFKNGGELVYLTPPRMDGDGTFARVRLPLGATADMVADRRSTLAANLGRASLETWPTKADEDGVLDLWIADKGKLGGGAGDWPLLWDGAVDVFEGVPFGLTQRGLIINAPLLESNYLIGGRPGQGKTSAMRTLLLGACLDPTVELRVFVMGESPDFAPLAPRLSQYRMGMDDQVAADAVTALAALLDEMERRGQTLSAQPGQPPKVSRKLADRKSLGLHPLILAIDECHELFQHRKYGKQAEELAVRLIKRGRKYGIILILATQSPTKDSIPKEVTRNVSCGVAFAVSDHIANDGLLGAGRYRAGIRATELRMKADRGTCVAVGVTDAPWELVRTFYVPFEDGTDLVTPVVARALGLITEAGRELITAPEAHEDETARVDHLADIAHVLDGEAQVRTQVVLSRLSAHNPDEYESWTARDLRAALLEHGQRPRKLHGGQMHVVATDVTRALADRAHHTETNTQPDRAKGGEEAGESPGKRGVFPATSPHHPPQTDQAKQPAGRRGSTNRGTPETPQKWGSTPPPGASLPAENNDRLGGADGP